MRYVGFAFLSVAKLSVLKVVKSPVKALSLVGFAGIAAGFVGLSVSQVQACGSGYGCGVRGQSYHASGSHHASKGHHASRSHVVYGSHHANRSVHSQRLHSSSLPSSQHMKAVALANNPYANGSSTMGRGHYGYGHGAYGHGSHAHGYGYAPHYGYSHHRHHHAYAPTAPYIQPYVIPSVMDLPVSLGIRPAPTPEPVIYSIHRDGRVSRRAISHVRHVKTVRKGYDRASDAAKSDTAQVETASGARIIYVR